MEARSPSDIRSQQAARALPATCCMRSGGAVVVSHCGSACIGGGQGIALVVESVPA
jgi:hypothetical protein